MKRMKKIALLLVAAALPLAAAQQSQAAGTVAGTVVTNTATLDYKVGGLTQPSTAAVANFNVDRKVNFVVNYVAPTGNFVNVYPGAQAQALKFTVSNQGNDTQDFDLTVAQLGGQQIFGINDSIDATDVKLYLDNPTTGAVGAFDAGDTEITTTHFLDEVTPDKTVTVFVVGTFPTPQTNGNVAGLSITANALYGHAAGKGGTIAGGSTTDTNGTVAGNAIYTVFADVADTFANSEVGTGAFRIIAPVLSISKSSSVIWDPINYNSTPRSIPGAYVQYAITITNDIAALASANLTTIQDTLNDNTLLDPNFVAASASSTLAPTSAVGKSFKVTHTATGRTATPTPSYYSAGTGVGVSGQSITANFATLLPAQDTTYSAGELKAGESVTLTFNVTIN
ncbi:hypothetical protein LPW11_06710 [Geomonas sp. RF6]|uniref:hypothetical protein n=1 Tax=Geomonas sp. RF6 TaxID=2897342 RepID=UPI001E36FE7D|nr:hypothetical protein [Geomonas sp. RF6]UFS71879.1 hypothetical protein LPW11_06710 [Geomonas sp. RF6]